MKTGTKIAIGCLAAAILIPGGLVVLMLLVAWTLGLDKTTIANTVRADNPDGNAALVIVYEGGGGAAGWTTTDYRIEYQDAEKSLSLHTGWTQAVDPQWTSATEVTVCDPLLSPEVSSTNIEGRTFVLRNRCVESVHTGPDTRIE